MFKLAKIVSFEGRDCVGKSTQARLFHQSLVDEGFKSSLIKIPFNDFLTHRIIYWMLFNGLARRYPTLFQFIQFINKFLFQTFVLTYLMLTRDFIVLDRWVMSSQAYGDADGASKIVTQTMNKLLLNPNRIVLIGGPVRKRPGAEDSYEKDNVYQARVANNYCKLSKGHNVVFFANIDGTPEEIATHVSWRLYLSGLTNFRRVREC